ncbi:LysR substrate-binding domain-containing protein [Zobellella endophytica]|uniref:LysR substrate-binding domain-containing protein n=1 Tax=Zobellella endophytica TaxID=2116700 RepID=UPI001B301D22|nr:LysR substrate-binding domain-containing protein [Zobellella endophytica]
MPIILVAAPAYLQWRREPAAPDDVAGHGGILTGPAAGCWSLSDGQGRSASVTPHPVMVANESVMLLGAAEAGLGITCLPADMCRASMDDGRLVRVLPEWEAGQVTTSLVMPHRRGQLPAVRAVVECLVEMFGAGEGPAD